MIDLPRPVVSPSSSSSSSSALFRRLPPLRPPSTFIPARCASSQNEDQNWKNYVYFIAYLRQKSKDDYSGAESDIAKKLEQLDPSWFPSMKSAKLQKFLEVNAVVIT